MSDTPPDWTTADADSLPEKWWQSHDDAGTCDRCGTATEMGEYCERCHEHVERMRARR